MSDNPTPPPPRVYADFNKPDSNKPNSKTPALATSNNNTRNHNNNHPNNRNNKSNSNNSHSNYTNNNNPRYNSQNNRDNSNHGSTANNNYRKDHHVQKSSHNPNSRDRDRNYDRNSNNYNTHSNQNHNHNDTNRNNNHTNNHSSSTRPNLPTSGSNPFESLLPQTHSLTPTFISDLMNDDAHPNELAVKAMLKDIVKKNKIAKDKENRQKLLNTHTTDGRDVGIQRKQTFLHDKLLIPDHIGGKMNPGHFFVSPLNEKLTITQQINPSQESQLTARHTGSKADTSTFYLQHLYSLTRLIHRLRYNKMINPKFPPLSHLSHPRTSDNLSTLHPRLRNIAFYYHSIFRRSILKVQMLLSTKTKNQFCKRCNECLVFDQQNLYHLTTKLLTTIIRGFYIATHSLSIAVDDDEDDVEVLPAHTTLPPSTIPRVNTHSFPLNTLDSNGALFPTNTQPISTIQSSTITTQADTKNQTLATTVTLYNPISNTFNPPTQQTPAPHDFSLQGYQSNRSLKRQKHSIKYGELYISPDARRQKAKELKAKQSQIDFFALSLDKRAEQERRQNKATIAQATLARRRLAKKKLLTATLLSITPTPHLIAHLAVNPPTDQRVKLSYHDMTLSASTIDHDAISVSPPNQGERELQNENVNLHLKSLFTQRLFLRLTPISSAIPATSTNDVKMTNTIDLEVDLPITTICRSCRRVATSWFKNSPLTITLPFSVPMTALPSPPPIHSPSNGQSSDYTKGKDQNRDKKPSNN